MLACTLGVLPLQALAFSPELFDHTLERLDKHLELAHTLAALGSQPDGLLLLVAILRSSTSNSFNLFVAGFLLRLEIGRELGRALLVLI